MTRFEAIRERTEAWRARQGTDTRTTQGNKDRDWLVDTMEEMAAAMTLFLTDRWPKDDSLTRARSRARAALARLAEPDTGEE